MRKSVLFLFIAILVSILSGCIIFVTPKDTTVIIAPDDVKTFTISVFPWDATYEWQMDGEVLTDETANYFTYQYANDGQTDHVLSVKATHPKGAVETYQWNLYVASSSQIVGPSGGKTEVTDTTSELYGTSIDIPQGALLGESLVRFNALNSHPVLPEDTILAGPVISVSVEDVQNNIPPSLANMKLAGALSTVTMTIPYWDSDKDGIVDHTGQPPENIELKVYDSNLQELAPPTITGIDRVNGTLLVTLDMAATGGNSFIITITMKKLTLNNGVSIFTIDGLDFVKTFKGKFLGKSDLSLRIGYLKKVIRDRMQLGLYEWEIYSYGEESNDPNKSWHGDATQTPDVVDDLRTVLRTKYDEARAENRKFILVTHSWGTMLGILALRYNQTGDNPIEPDLIITLSCPLGSNEVSKFNDEYFIDADLRAEYDLMVAAMIIKPDLVAMLLLFPALKYIDNVDIKVGVAQGDIDPAQRVIESFTLDQILATYDYINDADHRKFYFKKWINYWDNGDIISGPLPSDTVSDWGYGDFENIEVRKDYDKRTLKTTAYTHALTSMAESYWNDQVLKVLNVTVPTDEGVAFRDRVQAVLHDCIHAPLVDAGPDQTIAPDATVILNGAGSTDPDNDTLSYQWSQTSGPTITFTNAETAVAQFTASVAAGSVLTFKLTVTDEGGLKSTDTCVVTVSNSVSPYSISGTITKSSGGGALAGVSMSLSGTSSGFAATDVSGNYIFMGLANGSYTITPTLAGYVFTPFSQAVMVNGANATAINFIATAGSSDPVTALLNSLVYIPAGSFMMGSTTGYSDELPVHQVMLQAFDIGAYEVTQAQYLAVMGTNPSYFKAPSYPDSENNPVEEVSWYDARAFCTAISALTGRTFTLPSEAQWEYACRAGTTTLYSYGDSDALLGDYAWWYSNSGSQTHPVGTKLPNPWGLYDMMGNVWEWCLDSYHVNYTGAPTDGSAWEPDTGSDRMLRGGGWDYGSFPRVLRSAFRRDGNYPDYGRNYFGFRVLAVR